jgi:hypothetical protein
VRVSYKTVFGWGISGKIESVTVYGTRRFPKKELIDTLRRLNGGPKPKVGSRN